MGWDVRDCSSCLLRMTRGRGWGPGRNDRAGWTERGSKLRLALVQMHSEKGDIGRNLASIVAFVERAADAGAGMVCFPEMSLTGYVDPPTQPESLMTWDDERLEPLFALSLRHGVTLVVGMAELRDGAKPYIAQGVIREGALVGVYRKINVAPDEIDRFSRGEEPLVVRQGDVDLGIGICADVDDPALFKDYASRGAGLVLLLAAPGLDGPQASRDWERGYGWWRDKCRDQLGTYARDYGVQIAVATQAGRTANEDFPGGGYLFDARGELVASTEDGAEGMLVVDVGV